MNEDKNRVIDVCRDKYRKLLPDVNEEHLKIVLEECYEDGMTPHDLSRASYRSLYPVKEPTLF